MKCKYCGRGEIIYNNTEYCCNVCGVIHEGITQSYDNTENTAPLQYGHVIGSTDYTGKKIYTKLTKKGHTNKFKIAENIIYNISERLNLPLSCREDSIKLYKKLHNNKIIINRPIRVSCAACIYYMVRKYDIPITRREVLTVSNIKSKQLQKIITIINDVYPIKYNNDNIINKYLAKVCNKLNVEQKYVRAALNILNKIYTQNTTIHEGRSPMVIVCTVLYYVAHEKYTKEDIALSGGIHTKSIEYNKNIVQFK